MIRNGNDRRPRDRKIEESVFTFIYFCFLELFFVFFACLCGFWVVSICLLRIGGFIALWITSISGHAKQLWAFSSIYN